LISAMNCNPQPGIGCLLGGDPKEDDVKGKKEFWLKREGDILSRSLMPALGGRVGKKKTSRQGGIAIHVRGGGKIRRERWEKYAWELITGKRGFS